jgi:pimeloyl-ACP methyl ester carboxylesterase
MVRVLLAAAVVALVAAPHEAAARYSCSKTGEVHFKAADGTRLAGLHFGKGQTAVVFAHELGGGACQWMPYARQLAAKGYLTLAFDFRGYGSSQTRTGSAKWRLPMDVNAAAKEARKLGAKRVILVGASMGGTAVLTAAPNVAPPVNAVVSLSGPAEFGRMKADAAVPKLTVPVLYMVGSLDQDFVPDAHTLYDATTVQDKTLEIRETASHGVQLLGDAATRGIFERFLAAHR